MKVLLVILWCCCGMFCIPETLRATMDEDGRLEAAEADTSRKPDVGFYTRHFVQHRQDGGEGATFKRQFIRPWISGRLNHAVHYTAMLEFAGKPKLLDAHLDVRLTSQLQLRLGQWKVPFSSLWLQPDQAQSFIDLDFGDRLYPKRDRGITLCYSAPDKRYGLTAGIFSGASLNKRDKNRRQDVLLRATMRPQPLWDVSLAWYNGADNEKHFAPVNNIVAVGIANRHTAWTCHAEYIRRMTAYSGGADNTSESWALVLGYALPTNHRPVCIFEPMLRLDTVDYVAGYDGGRVMRSTIGLNIYFNNLWNKLQVNYEVLKEQGIALRNNRISAGFQLSL